MDRKLPVAVVAFLAAVLLLQPVVGTVERNLGDLTTSLAEGTFNPFGPPGSGGSHRTPLSFGVPGSIAGNLKGTFVPHAGAFGPVWSMDRDGTAGIVTINLVCDPALGAMKRLKVYDVVGPDYTLRVSNSDLSPPKANPLLNYDTSFTCSFPVRLQGPRAVAIYSPTPDAVVTSASTNPPLPNVQILRDGAGTYYVEAPYQGIVNLTVHYRANATYFRGLAAVPPDLTLSNIPASDRPQFPGNLRAYVRPVLQAYHLTNETNLRTVLDRLQRTFLGFGQGAIPDRNVFLDKFQAIALGDNGCCRHRAFAFMVVAQDLGIPARIVANEAHAFVEVRVPNVGWIQLNLGGCGTYRVKDIAGGQPLVTDATSPAHHRPNPGNPGLVRPSNTTVIESPPVATAGVPFHASIRVIEAAGTTTASVMPNVTVDLYVNGSKDSPGILVARGATDPDGIARLDAYIPPSAVAGRYQLVAHALPTRQGPTLYQGSWSDPTIRVVTGTAIVPRGPAVVGLDTPTDLRLSLLNAGGTPIADAPLRLAFPNGTNLTRATDAAGTAVFNVTFHSLGQVALRADYPGDADHHGATAPVDVRVVTTSVDAPQEVAVVRNATWNATGTVYQHGRTVPGVDVYLALQDGLVNRSALAARGESCQVPPANLTASCLLHAITDASGAYHLAVPLRANATLGPADAWVVLAPDGGASVHQVLDVRFAPRLSILASDSTAGNPVQVVLQLRDDGGAPLGSQRLSLTGTQGGNATTRFTVTTDPSGLAVVSIPAGWTRPGNLDLRASFDGGSAAAPTVAVVRTHVAPSLLSRILAWPGTPVVALATLVVAGLAAALLRGYGPAEGADALLLRVRGRRQPRLRILLPDVPESMPDLWGVGEALTVVVQAELVTDEDRGPLRDLPVTLASGDVRLEGRTDDDGLARFLLTPETTGTVELVARSRDRREDRLVPARADRFVVVTTHREAVADLYNALLDQLAERASGLDDATTPRELYQALRDAGVARDAAWDLVVGIERAWFSDHPVGRGDVERFADVVAGLRSSLDLPRPRGWT